MVTREDIVVEVQKLPEKYLPELYQIIKLFEERADQTTDDDNVMAALRGIRISASPDLSTDASLYHIDDMDAR